jgi:23S rRNA pseudoU1915 N3-methylase RlmH
MSERGRSKSERQAEILSYFLRHPQSADTLEGVARWRLMEERILTTVEETREAIESLVAQEYLSRIPTAGYVPLYGINREKQQEAEQFLRERKAERPPKENFKVEITLKNRSPYLMIVTLNSGSTLHLASGQMSEAIDDLEVNGNAKVEKLVNSGQLSIHTVEHQHVVD